MNRNWLKDRRCAQCWGYMVMRDGELICPKGCQPGGHVSIEYVDRMKAKEVLELSEVAEAYPELAEGDPDYEPVSDSDIRYAKQILGMGDGTIPSHQEESEFDPFSKKYKESHK